MINKSRNEEKLNWRKKGIENRFKLKMTCIFKCLYCHNIFMIIMNFHFNINIYSV